ncbi:MAG TPA: sulfite exporter TauE/SafE family protein [Sphingomicrobium sp.]|nr:sulfite exporter TauE/SafE family protein [Sphingomicrobium sp.]
MVESILTDPSALVPFILIGFAAQLVDGALGMAYGQISTTILISIGVPPAAASAGVHTAETFTTAVSGISHVAHRNVDWRLFFRIVIPGILAGILGAYVLTQIPAEQAKPFVLVYLTALGLYLFYRGIMHRHTERRPRIVEPLGFVGGFLDAAGGGGWGAIVTSNLLVQGSNPRKTIGTVNTAEFFLTVSISGTFFATFTLAGTLDEQALLLKAIVGLLIGGVCAAPFGAWIAKRVKPDTLLTFVGALVMLVSGYGLYRALIG